MRTPNFSSAARRIAVIAGLAAMLIAVVAHARPGGGQSYSGGSSHSSSGGSSHSGGGGGGGGGAGVFYLILLCLEHPIIGIPIVLIVVAYFVIKARSSGSGAGWSTANSDDGDDDDDGPDSAPPPPPAIVTRATLDQLRQADPDFSLVLFEDFIYTLYAELHRARAQRTADHLSPYLVKGALAAFGEDPGLREVRGIVIGAMRYTVFNVASSGRPTTVEIEFEANYGEVTDRGERRLYVVERMTVTRSAQAKSRPPARARTLDCPNCGAPLEHVRGDQCSYCKQHVGGGRFDWIVGRVVRTACENRGPLIGGDVAEQGNDLPTVSDPSAQARVDAIRARDPSFDWNQFQQRVSLVFDNLQVAWSTREWLRARPFVTDNLFQSQMYWIDLYIQQRARNVTERARVIRIDLAAAASDKYFDAITVRMWATGLDYTVSDDGRMLGGSRTKERGYSEYWTLIRGSQHANKPTTTTPACPNCGAPLAIAMTGNCKYCGVKVTTGEFDWVLSRIEQDESYGG